MRVIWLGLCAVLFMLDGGDCRIRSHPALLVLILVEGEVSRAEKPQDLN